MDAGLGDSSSSSNGQGVGSPILYSPQELARGVGIHPHLPIIALIVAILSGV